MSGCRGCCCSADAGSARGVCALSSSTRAARGVARQRRLVGLSMRRPWLSDGNRAALRSEAAPQPAGLMGWSTCSAPVWDAAWARGGPLGQLLGPSDSEACPPGPVWLCVEPIGWVPEKSWPALTSRSGGARPPRASQPVLTSRSGGARPPHASRPALTSRSGSAGPLMPAGDVSSGSSKTVLS